MLPKSMLVLSAGLLLNAIVSCKTSTSSEKMIVGTWVPVSSQAVPETGMKIKFLENKIGIAEMDGQKAQARDSITYEIKNDGKLLVTRERSGKVQEVQIIKVDEKELVLFSKDMGDTIRMKRQ